MSDPARAMSKDDALAELLDLQSGDVIRLEGPSSPAAVSLDGWDGQQLAPGNVGGVVIRYLSSGTKRFGSPANPGAPDRLDLLIHPDGIWGCTFVGECTEVCPKHVDPAAAIQR